MNEPAGARLTLHFCKVFFKRLLIQSNRTLIKQKARLERGRRDVGGKYNLCGMICYYLFHFIIKLNIFSILQFINQLS